MGMLGNEKYERYAFERALLVPKLQAARAAGFERMTAANAARLERNKKIRRRIDELRAVDEDLLREKRARIEARLCLVAFGNLFDFAQIKDGVPVIDWELVKQSEAACTFSEFVVTRDGEAIVRFKRDDALAAIAQLRDMHGFKAPSRNELTGKDGGPMETTDVTDAMRAAALVALMAKAKQKAA